MRCFILTLITIFLLALPFYLVRADELDDVTRKLEDLTRVFNDIKKATDTNENTLRGLNQRLEGIKNQVAKLEEEITRKEGEVRQGEEALVYQKNLLGERVKSYYKNISRVSGSLINLLVAKNLTSSLQNFFYQKSLADEDKQTIIRVVLYIKDLEDKKTKLQSEKEKLIIIKKTIDDQSQFLSGEVKKARKYQGELQQQIASLSARQQQLIAQKLASLNISRSAATLGRCDSDLTNGRDPGFSPRFAFFTYGVPNRVGLNQWGAYGRAKDGQNYDQILRAYYNFDGYQNFDVNLKINVDGYGSFSLDDYVKRIYEVPGDWPSEVLKAQAIAARSYALSYTNNGSGSICATENCQVFQSNPKGGAWDQAVNDTAGKAMVQGGRAIKAWFSSTHGGYVRTAGEIGWSDSPWTKHAIDSKSAVNNFSDLQNNSYDRESPWFYCDWGSRGDFNKTAWLKSQEVSDIINTILLAKKDSSVQEHLYQPDKSNPAGTDTWDNERVKSELRSRGSTPFNSISDISVGADFNGGRTTSVNVTGDGGSTSFDAGEFKNFFNLRAPANIQIVGPLFNVEKK